MTFAFQKKNKKDLFAKLQSQLEQSTKKQSNSKDERFWKPSMGKEGTGYAVIRFLPGTVNDELPWVKVYNHAFQGPGGSWLIENCPTTINKPCPICSANRELWNTGSESKQNVARDRKRKTSYISNIYVVSDPTNPENEGKVFLYKYGAKIFEKIMAVMQPEFEDEEPINPFDLKEGADFKLKISKNGPYWSYEKSGFTNPNILEGYDDSELEDVFNKQYALADFVDESQYKSSEQLQERMNMVLGLTSSQPEVKQQPVETPKANKFEDDEPTFNPNKFKTTPVVEDVEEDEEDPMSYFSRLAAE
jgi:hypothetical protein